MFIRTLADEPLPHPQPVDSPVDGIRVPTLIVGVDNLHVYLLKSYERVRIGTVLATANIPMLSLSESTEGWLSQGDYAPM
jgi:hypothetical protein